MQLLMLSSWLRDFERVLALVGARDKERRKREGDGVEVAEGQRGGGKGRGRTHVELGREGERGV